MNVVARGSMDIVYTIGHFVLNYRPYLWTAFLSPTIEVR